MIIIIFFPKVLANELANPISKLKFFKLGLKSRHSEDKILVYSVSQPKIYVIFIPRVILNLDIQTLFTLFNIITMKKPLSITIHLLEKYNLKLNPLHITSCSTERFYLIQKPFYITI